MKFFMLRHGAAEPYAARDALRQLTPRGIEQTHEILTLRSEPLQTVTRIVASPYVRAQQTAQLVSRQLGLPVETYAGLQPESSLTALAQWLESCPVDEVPLLVTHQPLIGSFVDWCCGFLPGRYVLGTSALVSLEAELMAGGCGQLLWLQQPA